MRNEPTVRFLRLLATELESSAGCHRFLAGQLRDFEFKILRQELASEDRLVSKRVAIMPSPSAGMRCRGLRPALTSPTAFPGVGASGSPVALVVNGQSCPRGVFSSAATAGATSPECFGAEFR
jgi:hypothetical protein